ncbi:PIN domain-containing protein [Microbacterium sp. X-17]|uniref:PIN domain-containing protein n=1 Tax=Microbacterium sp. X-17 TaxID=3144404 RepID=UPI0031F5358C
MTRAKAPTLREGVSAEHAARLLREAAREAGNVAGRLSAASHSDQDYLDWAHTQASPLASVLPPVEMDRLLFTRRYWATYENATVQGNPYHVRAISQELGDRQAELTAAADALDEVIAEWAYKDAEGAAPARWHALVLDTNVLELHHHHLSELNWWQRLELPEGGLRLIIPSVVRDELDAHKLTSNQPLINRVKVEQRKQASLALRYLNRTVPQGKHGAELDTPVRSRLGLDLQVDELDHRRLPSPDNEIVARALDLVPFAQRVYLASYDNNIRSTAELYGLTTLRLDYADVDEADVQASMGR